MLHQRINLDLIISTTIIVTVQASY